MKNKNKNKNKTTKTIKKRKFIFNDEFDEICWYLEHPTPELYSLIKKLDEVGKKLDTSKVKVIDCY